ncbi:MAG: hypothetical protein J6Y37_08480, partial [Paludibacteraceae bacterium]|nr:hypothetical protein [Paludibacteraceae bacterium]
KDVKFQKNKLKKSFLRLSFYDSTNPANQNLLSYSTIFYNSGNAFAKYARYVERDGYFTVSPNGTLTRGLVGCRVNREPESTSLNGEYPEDYRISSQFVVSDKYLSNSSSDGFYLYLWKDSFNGKIPSDIYMKVEFNHAGLGRTIPFMMPYKDNALGIKTFSEILSDWNGSNRYGIRKYIRYSYIRFKYRYDIDTGIHVYYLDDNVYGNSVYTTNFNDGTITLNLYEAKII